MANLPSEAVGVTLTRYLRATEVAAWMLCASTVLTFGIWIAARNGLSVMGIGTGWPTSEIAPIALFLLLSLAALAHPHPPSHSTLTARGSDHGASVPGTRRGHDRSERGLCPRCRTRISRSALIVTLVVACGWLALGDNDQVADHTLVTVVALSLAGLLMATGRLARIRTILVACGGLIGPAGLAYVLVTSGAADYASGVRALGVVSTALTTLAAFALTSLAPSGAPAVVLRTYPAQSAVVLAAVVVVTTPALDALLGTQGPFSSPESISGLAVLVLLALGVPWAGWFAVRVVTWRAVAVSGSDAVITLHPSGRIESVDPGTESLTGWKPHELRGVDLATLVVGDGSAELHRHLAEAADSMTPSLLDEKPSRLRGPMGTGVDVSARLVPTITADGVRVVVTLTDAGSEAEYRRRAFQDPLTGVLNRRGLFVELERALGSTEERVAVMFVDLDHFKQINDQASHAAGDEALRHVAQSLQQSLRSDDRVGRFGGDEFVCVLRGVAQEADLHTAAARLRQRLSELSIETTAGPRRVTVSIGAAIAGAGCDSESLLASADTALAEAKRLGRNRIVVSPAEINGDGSDHDVVVDARTGTAHVRRSSAARAGAEQAPVEVRGRDQRASTDPSRAVRP